MPPTRLIGRAHEVVEVGALLSQPHVRLLTLTGPGGVGKSRLGLEVATAQDDAFPDGIHMVSLATIHDPALVLPTVVRALGIRGDGSQSLMASLVEQLGGRRLLLILDNFEQVVDASITVAELLAACPGLKVLATSRVALEIRAEHEYPVGPLEPTGDSRGVRGSTTRVAPAVALFVERARAVCPGFELTAENTPAVAEICSRVDGLPLAIELAGARIRVLPPDAILERLESRLDLLSRGPRDLPDRHQTMRDAIAWSYSLLGPDERELFRRCAVFVGGFSLEAIEAVARDAGVSSVVNRLASLVRHNMLNSETVGGQARFRMLETIREFALERLRAEGELDGTRCRHARWYLALAERAEPELVREQQRRWLDRLESEQGNMRAALDWLHSSGDVEMELRLAAALWRYWATRGDLREGYDRLDRALARDGGAHADVRAKAHQHIGNLAVDLGDYGAGRAHYEASLAIRRPQGDLTKIAEPLNGLGLLAFYRGDYTEARRCHEESLALRRASGDAHGLSNSLVNLGDVASAQGDYQRAELLHEEALAARRNLGNANGVASCLLNLGEIAWGRGDRPLARSRFEASLALFREVGDRLGVGNALYSLGRVAHAEGKAGQAAALYTEALPLRRDVGDRRGIIECMEGIAAIASPDDVTLAVTLCAAAETLRVESDAPLRPVDRALQERALAVIRSRVGKMAFGKAWSAGSSMSMALALTEASRLAQRIGARRENLPAGLSAREVEVLRLVATGMTTAQIANELFLSTHTVNAHLRRIYGKIGVTSRSAATRFFLDSGLD
ncbi:MAG TPA: tetratricopeptide repeat protein [Thermomicrobiales bacterium]|nr:tetratricopeptide repeat protein [Thermomicrobiales bacterium]